jgi:hypothetical protein
MERGEWIERGGGATTVSLSEGGTSTWINGRRWDVTWLIGSAVIVPLVLLCVWAGLSSVVINLGVTAVIGGPHLFATYTATYMDPRFRRSHGWALVAVSIAVPAFVIWTTIHQFQILLSVFIFAASGHVLQQNAYLVDVYRKRAAKNEPWWSRIVDYGLLMLCIYPGAAYKLVNSTFYLGDVRILIPSFLMVRATYWTIWIFFGLFLVAWIGKTIHEARREVLNVPKTLLIGATTAVAFAVPWLGTGDKLELAFQAVNAWHSVQYMGVVWYVQKVRKERGLIDSPFVAKMSGEGRPAWYFYGFCTAVTLGLFTILGCIYLADPWKLSFAQYYYMGVLSCLLIHYVLDAYLFAVGNRRASNVETIPYAAPTVAVTVPMTAS